VITIDPAPPLTPSIAVTVWTLWHGTELSGDAVFALGPDDVRIQLSLTGVELRIPFAALDGAHVAPDHLSLYATMGDVVELSGSSDIEEAGRQLRDRVCTLSEVTLALRGLGSARANPGRDHDRFFGPLLAARRAAERASDPGGRLAALRAPALGAEMERVFHEFAVERFPVSLPDRRALEAELEDLAGPFRASLRRLAGLSAAAASARDDTAFVWWRAWAAECRTLFVSADRTWLAMMPVLARHPIPATRSWRWPWRSGRPAAGGEGGKGGRT
jgi:hypothetical protein